MIIGKLIDIHELAELPLHIEIKPNFMFVDFALDEEGLSKSYTIITTAELEDDGWYTLTQTLKDSPYLYDYEVPDQRIVEAIFNV